MPAARLLILVQTHGLNKGCYRSDTLRGNNNNMEQLHAASKKFILGYKNDTPASLKLIDVYLVYIMLTGIVQFVYMAIAGTFPYNAFLGGFISTVGSFVLAANLRIQTNSENRDAFKTISPERAFADFVVCSLLLHGFCIHFLG